MPEEKQKEEKTKVVEQTFYQKHKFGIIFTSILVVVTILAFGIGFSIEKKSPENLPPKEPKLNTTAWKPLDKLSTRDFLARADSTPPLPDKGTVLNFTVGSVTTYRFIETSPK